MSDDRTFTRQQQSRVLIALSTAMIVLAIDITIVNVAIPSIGQAFNASDAQLQWVLDAFNVVMAGTVLLGSGLGDRYGRKRLLVLGLCIFAAASILAAAAPNIGVLIGARALMGFAVAMVMPATFSLLAVVFPPDRRPFAIGVWTAVGGLGLAFGPVVGGILLEVFSWPAVFLVNVPIAALAIVLGIMFLPESKEVVGKRLDYLGALLSIIGLGGLVFGAIEGPSMGWSSPIVIAALVLGAISTVAFVYWEAHTSSPMFEIRVLKIPAVQAGAFAVMMTYFVVFTVLYLIPQYLQYVLDFSDIAVGIALLPLGAIFGILSPFNSRMIKRFGTRTTLVGGLMVVTIGLVTMAGIGHHGYLFLGIGLALVGVGWAGCLAPATSVILDALPVRLAGSGSSVNQVARQVGGSLGVAIIGSVVSTVFRSGMQDIALIPDPIVDTASKSLGEATRIANTLPADVAPVLHDLAIGSFDKAARIGFLIAAVLSLLSAIFAMVAVHRGSEADDPEGPDNELTHEQERAHEEHRQHTVESAHHFVGTGSKTHS